MTLLINIIGAGNLGKTIGHLLARNSQFAITGICNTSKHSTISAIDFIGSGVYYPSISNLPPADITFITTPDDHIESTCNELSQNDLLKHNSIVLHCSGSLGSDILRSVSNKGCLVASVHPMRSFAKPELSIQNFSGTYCAIEGDSDALDILTFMFDQIGGITYRINKDKKSNYHAAGVFSSNYLITLAQQSLECLEDAGVDKEMAIGIITNLMRGSIANIERTSSPKDSLTGPIQRGDISTIKKHMESLENGNKLNLYSSLGKATLELTDHTEEKKNIIEEILHQEETTSSNQCNFLR